MLGSKHVEDTLLLDHAITPADDTAPPMDCVARSVLVDDTLVIDDTVAIGDGVCGFTLVAKNKIKHPKHKPLLHSKLQVVNVNKNTFFLFYFLHQNILPQRN